MDESTLLTEVSTEMFKHDENKQSQFLRPTDTGELLKRLLWQEFELSRMAFGWVPAVSQYEAKLKIGRFAYLHNRNVQFLEKRIKELPVPLSTNDNIAKITRAAFERLSLAKNEQDFFISYFFILQRLFEQYDDLMNRLDPILDAPTADQLKLIFVERETIVTWLREQIRFIPLERNNEQLKDDKWNNYIHLLWQQYFEALQHNKRNEEIAYPVHPVEEAQGPVPMDSAWDEEQFPLYEGRKTVEDLEKEAEQSFEGALQRGKNFDDPLMSPLYESVKQMVYINATEIGPAEALCYSYYCIDNLPLAYFHDLARHIWDELRHTEMGVRRLKQLGYSTKEFKFMKGSPGREITKEWVRDAYSGLTMVAEPCSFTKKRKSAEAFWKFGDALSAIQTEFDIADERLHVDFGKKWGPELYKQANEYYTAKELSEKIRIQRLKELGVTEEDVEKVVKNFPMFCGFSTVELQYDKY